MFNNNSELLKKAKEGDIQARDKLFEVNMGLVKKIASKFLSRGIEFDDAVQIGSIGLYKAIEKFDFSYSVQFSTYAVPMIMGEIKRFLRDDGIIKVSRSIKENYSKIMMFLEEKRQKEDREPTVTEISQALNMDTEDVVTALSYNPNCESLNSTLSEDGNLSLMDTLSDGNNQEEKIIDKLSLHSVLDTLSERERELIELRYFKEKTQSQVAEKLSISQVQVSRIEKKVLNKLKEKLVFS